MYKVKIFSIGKNKKSWLDEALSIYEKRLKGKVEVSWILVKDLSSLEKISFIHTPYICLDEKGDQMTSSQFADFFFQEGEKSGLKLNFFVGGAEGLSPRIKTKALALIGLSNLTFPHQFVRLLLLEQIYRSFEIFKNSPYHK